uniref:TNF receptor-associated factor n=1 Tax=Cynoglossus semilaevis TaxID=244447 RepID=A0A3P8W1A0_CYNSE
CRLWFMDCRPAGIFLSLSWPEEDKHLCNSCQKILRRPLQAQCGHRFCSFCFNKIVSSGPQNCNACIKEDLFEEPASILKQGGAFPDNAARREVEALAAVCPNQGCTWIETIKEFEVNAKATFTLRNRQKNQEVGLFFNPVWAHDEICPKYPMICEGCAKKKIPREKYVDHIKFCSKFKFPCRFHVFGCDLSVEKEKINDHERQCSYEHLNLLEMSYLEGSVNTGAVGGSSAALVQAACAPTMTTSFIPFPTALAAALELQLQSEKTKVVELKVSMFENIVCVLNREMECSCATMEAYNRQHQLDLDKIEILNNKFRQLERTVSLRDLSIVEMEGKMREMSAATYDGVFVWTISDFTKKRQDAVAGRAPAMFSPVFYTSKYGYKMCLWIYLNGDGTGQGTHLSLFFVWPFNQKVTLLLDQIPGLLAGTGRGTGKCSSRGFHRPVGGLQRSRGQRQ